MKVAAITLRKGHIIDFEGKMMIVVSQEIMQPGKGASVIQVEMRDVRKGNKTNVRFSTQEMVERLRLEQAEYQFLYADGDIYHFMNQETFEQVTIEAELIGDPQRFFLQENMIVEVESFEGEPLSVTLPQSVIFEIAEADPVVKGQTASSSYKPAVLTNGVKIMVPPFVEAGERVVVRIEDATYMERAKDK
jgi:elongation factor P